MKTILKNALIPILTSRPASALAERFVQPGIPIFMLHRFISSDNPERGHDPSYLDDCLKYLTRNKYSFITVEKILYSLTNHETLPEKTIAFTMDDGFEDQATVAAPVFLENNCPVTIFLISGMLDAELWPWDDQVAHIINNTPKTEFTLSLNDDKKSFSIAGNNSRHKVISNIQNWIKTLDGEHLDNYLHALSHATGIQLSSTAPSKYKSMSWDQARQLEQQGIQFAPHTRSHRILSQLNKETVIHEITHSWKRLSEELSSATPIFCYPTGRARDFGTREIDTIRQAGLLGAVSTEATFVDPSTVDTNYKYQLPRFSLPDTFEDFVQYSSWIERAKTQLRR